VISGEDFTRRTLRVILARGVGRVPYLLTRCLALWLAAGVGVLVVTLLAAAAGPYVHARAVHDPISLEGLGEALVVAVRAWVACLPFIVATLFWAVLARRAGPAMGVGVGLHALEFLNGFVLPIVAVALAGAGDVQVPPIWRVQLQVMSVTLGHSADVFVNWGSPFMMKGIFIGALGLGGGSLLPTTPWRAVAFLAGYSILPLGGAMWVLHRRDVTYGT
jgi:hypothetical protein